MLYVVAILITARATVGGPPTDFRTVSNISPAEGAPARTARRPVEGDPRVKIKSQRGLSQKLSQPPAKC